MPLLRPMPHRKAANDARQDRVASLHRWQPLLPGRFTSAVVQMKRSSTPSGRSTAEKVLRWLERGGRAKVQAAVRRAIEHTKARNKARRLDPRKLDERFTI